MNWERVPRVARWSAATVVWATAGCWQQARQTRSPLVRLLFALLTPPVAVAFTVATVPILTAAAIGTVGWRAGRWLVGADQERSPTLPSRTRPRPRPARRWPSTPPFSRSARRVLQELTPEDHGLPEPVGVFAGRYQGAILWREDVETFAAYLTRTTSEGTHREVWVGEHAAQYPTVESLAEALNSRGLDLDPASYDLARSYQQTVWDRIGSCTMIGTHHDDGNHRLTIQTPGGQTRPLAPAPDRDDRSAAFGPPASLSWGESGAGALETARCLLEYTGSTTRTPQELFDDARSLVITNIRTWPPSLALSVADLHRWASTHSPIPHRPINPTVHQAQLATTRAPAQRPPRQCPGPTCATPPHPPERYRRRSPTHPRHAAGTRGTT